MAAVPGYFLPQPMTRNLFCEGGTPAPTLCTTASEPEWLSALIKPTLPENKHKLVGSAAN